VGQRCGGQGGRGKGWLLGVWGGAGEIRRPGAGLGELVAAGLKGGGAGGRRRGAGGGGAGPRANRGWVGGQLGLGWGQSAGTGCGRRVSGSDRRGPGGRRRGPGVTGKFREGPAEAGRDRKGAGVRTGPGNREAGVDGGDRGPGEGVRRAGKRGGG